ncbi:MAG: S66 peptidase family protein [Alphaproteobacteria bacterium]
MNSFKKIGICAPSSYVERAEIEAGVAALAARGVEVFVHEQAFARLGQSAGTAAQKVEALHDLYRDSSIDAIWAAGGGNRALQIVDDLDYDLIRANPKPLIGFSDVTALLNAITVRIGITNIHAQVFKNVARYAELGAVLAGDFTMDLRDARILNAGAARGRLFGGNLSVFQYLPATIKGDWLDGAILFLEDCHEEISRIDRMFIHLKSLGVFGRIGGLMLGGFTDLQDGGRPFGLSLEDIAREHCDAYNIPVLMDAPFGHGDRLSPLPIGGMAELDLTAAPLFSILHEG